MWSAPSPLKQVIRLDSRYGDCRRLFCNQLEVRPATIEHVADELCSLQEENSEGIVQRCEELLMILKQHLTGGSELPAPQFLRLRHARIFPVMKARDPSKPLAEPRMILRALGDEDWYIPDRFTLEVAFRGKVDILKFSIRSVILLDSLFSKLSLQKKYLSFVIDETVNPRGAIRKDPRKDRDLNIRTQYFSW